MKILSKINGVKISDAAKILQLHPQTVYRKIARNEIPFFKIGKTIRVSSDFLKSSNSEIEETKPIPSFLHPLFWDVNPQTLSPHDSIVIERILELGDLPHVRYLQTHVPIETLVQFLKTLGQKRLSEKSYSFWSFLLKADDE